jgi:hypothetical protein
MPNPEMLKFNIDSFIPDAILLIRSCQTQKKIIWKRGHKSHLMPECGSAGWLFKVSGSFLTINTE